MRARNRILGQSRKVPKAPPPSAFGIHEPEKFQEFIETLEICRGHILADASVPIRLAIIVLDNVAEVLMLHCCRAIFENDGFANHILVPQYSLSDQQRVERDFGGKIWFLTTKVRFISDADATVLRIGHSYRNAGFHRDEHNDEANHVIVRLLFEAVSRLLTAVYGNGVISGGHESLIEWLRQYGIKEPYLAYGPASREIGRKLLKGITVSTARVQSALLQDLVKRSKALRAAVSGAFPLPELVLDEILKTEEFEQHYDYERGASGRFRNLTRSIGQGKRVTSQRYRRLEREYWTEVRQAYAAFVPSLTWNELQKLIGAIGRLQRKTTADAVLAAYESISDRLARAEHLFSSAIRKSEAAADLAAEVAMGK